MTIFKKRHEPERPEEPKQEIVNMVLPEQPLKGEGKLNVQSFTWAFILNWAKRELMLARGVNDRPNNTELQTALIRGRIKLLKEIISLPYENELTPAKLEEQYEDTSTFAGYGD